MQCRYTSYTYKLLLGKHKAFYGNVINESKLEYVTSESGSASSHANSFLCFQVHWKWNFKFLSLVPEIGEMKPWISMPVNMQVQTADHFYVSDLRSSRSELVSKLPALPAAWQVAVQIHIALATV